ncbi:hypothetical protein A1OE_1181 [Candidatus Endolissoclinum faulkneri L2]|uniref:Uncharacterized protein n=1 Tax=Candidatus Endolissoclinum faulkneri L2 TaxID=1193729 RepID=K7YS38_9PROT|nr:hypothetical protein A1OE_1181 [Candidatus Endolissoclinum faulkneri L2]
MLAELCVSDYVVVYNCNNSISEIQTELLLLMYIRRYFYH